MAEVDNFDKEIMAQINKKQAIEAMSGLYSHLPPAMIEQIYDFCNDSKMADYNEYIYLLNNYEALTAKDLKRFYKLQNRIPKSFRDLPQHKKYSPDEVIPDSISVVENRPITRANVEFIPKLEEEPYSINITNGQLL